LKYWSHWRFFPMFSYINFNLVKALSLFPTENANCFLLLWHICIYKNPFYESHWSHHPTHQKNRLSWSPINYCLGKAESQSCCCCWIAQCWSSFNTKMYKLASTISGINYIHLVFIINPGKQTWLQFPFTYPKWASIN
jgi:hypothetical protein